MGNITRKRRERRLSNPVITENDTTEITEIAPTPITSPEPKQEPEKVDQPNISFYQKRSRGRPSSKV